MSTGERMGRTEERASGAPPTSPGIHVPPPFILAAAVGFGIVLNHWLPAPLFPAGSKGVGVVLGWILVASGAALSVWTLLTFWRIGTGIMPNRPARRLVTHGPYRRSRNPMYLSVSSQGLGVALLVDSVWPVLLLPVALVLLSLWVVRAEERYLAAAFGDAYEAYRRSVRRWL